LEAELGPQRSRGLESQAARSLCTQRRYKVRGVREGGRAKGGENA